LRRGRGRKVTHVNDALNLAEDSGNRCTNKGYSVEETGFSNENVEKGLVYADELKCMLAKYYR
jgi:hypothetical protein